MTFISISCPSGGVGVLPILYISQIFKLWTLEALFLAWHYCSIVFFSMPT